MSDYILRVIAKEANVRGLFAVTTGLTREAAVRHETSGASTLALAETLTAGILMGALLKVRQRVALKFEGNGPLGKAVVEADSYGHVRGYVAEPHLPAGMSVPDALGQAGLLTVVKDLMLPDLPKGIVHLPTSHVDQDLTYYLNQSEQIPSVVAIGVAPAANRIDGEEIEVAGGLLIQSLPPHDEELIARFVDQLQELPPLVDLLRGGRTPEMIAAELFDKLDIPYEELEKRPASFQCSCSRERTLKALISIGREELEQILAAEGRAIVDCHFCHAQYVFEREALEEIIASLQNG